MYLSNTYLEEGFPFHGRKQKQMEAFLKKSGLTPDSFYSYSVLLTDQNGSILGCGSRYENVLKCIAIDETYQGEGLLAKIVTQLVKQAAQSGISHLFLFTKPSYQTVFTDMGFYKIIATDTMLLLENRKDGIVQYLKSEAEPFSTVSSDVSHPVSAIVMNANPFTKGHQYLVEIAAKKSSLLHVFVLSEDASEFPSDVRLELVKKGCSHLPNVSVHGSSDYLISHATFPDYFFKEHAVINEDTAKLDLEIFAHYYAPAFHITARFVGEEPFSKVTNAYNQQMKTLLPKYGIDVFELPRKQNDDTIISATLVRRLFLENQLEVLKNFVPVSTYEYLVSEDGQKLRASLLSQKEGL